MGAAPGDRSAEQKLGLYLAVHALFGDYLQRAHALFAVAVKACQEAEHFVNQRQGADQIVVRALHHSRVDSGRVELENAVVKPPGLGGVS